MYPQKLRIVNFRNLILSLSRPFKICRGYFEVTLLRPEFCRLYFDEKDPDPCRPCQPKNVSEKSLLATQTFLSVFTGNRTP